MLPDENRLRLRRDFTRVYRRGISQSGEYFVCYKRANGGRAARIGFSVSKKMGGACERNRIKRRFRHAVRSVLGSFPAGFDYVFIVRRPSFDCPQDKLAAALSRAAQRDLPTKTKR